MSTARISFGARTARVEDPALLTGKGRFIDDIAQSYRDADLVVCRAGAITVSELCAAGVAAILVPLVVSTTDHQRFNAEFLAERGAALVNRMLERERQAAA